VKHIWYERNAFVKDFIPSGSIVDFGCGQREILDFVAPTEYLGIDCNEHADIYHDLNDSLVLDKQYDVGLWLGVLEYLNDPAKSVRNQKDYAKQFIVLTLNVKIKQHHGWKNAFNRDSIDKLLCNIFAEVEHHTYNRYTLSVCK
jgi:hypothetical protein